MTLATHAIVGAAVANLVPTHPIVGFIAGFASHFIIDAIPHWHYPMATIQHDHENEMNSDMVINRYFALDLMVVALDAALGIFLSLFFFGPFNFSAGVLISATFLGAIGGILPDALQFGYWKWRHQPLIALQRFHIWIHAKTNLDDKHVLGIAQQLLLIVLAVLIVRLFYL